MKQIAPRKILKDVYSKSKKSLLKNSVYAYWWNKKKNFGDILNPVLYRHFGMNLVHVNPCDAEILSIGSILHNLKKCNKFSGYIIGSGLIKDMQLDLRHAKILAVRGPLTAERVSAPDDVILGDPGLLVSELLKKRKIKKYELGIIPHYEEKAHKSIQQICEKHRDEVHLIDIQVSPKKFLHEIDQCKYVISSSLHGLITADSLGIPNIRFRTSEKAVGGGDFKYRDYNKTVGRDDDLILLNGSESLDDVTSQTGINQKEVNLRKAELHALFGNLKEILINRE